MGQRCARDMDETDMLLPKIKGLVSDLEIEQLLLSLNF